jgi:uncharacterized protein YeaO (DUF488 family)
MSPRSGHKTDRSYSSYGLAVRRAYEAPSPADGFRVLVDRLWPRGLAKEKAKVDLWLRDIAPSNELRHWYGHVPERWPEFKRRYYRELAGAREALATLRGYMARGKVTLVFSSKEEKLNNAVALAEYLER